ncbi:hypothetical protein RYX36_024943 [Vicia faba]
MARRTRTYNNVVVLLYSNLLIFFVPIVISLRSLTPEKSINYNDYLVSETGNFEAGFTNIENSQNIYFCIWYKNLNPRTIVWVANRDTPLQNSTGVFNFKLKLTDTGNPAIVDGSENTIWFSNASTVVENPFLLLLDTGNIIVRNGSLKDVWWQSFDYPGDTLLPGMILRTDRISGAHNSLISWKNTGDPARGEFSYHIDSNGFPQLFISKGSVLVYRLGPWNGFFFTGIPWETLYSYFNFSFEITEKQVAFKYEPLNDTIVSRYLITPTGFVQRYIWLYQTETWQLFLAGPGDQCENYNICGANSDCNVGNQEVCKCLVGFAPKSFNDTDGCVRKVKLDCDDRDGFVKYTKMKLPDTSGSWFDKKMNLVECEKQCLKNCSCIAYASLNIKNGGSGCIIWFNNIIDMRTEISVGQEIYIRVAASELGSSTNNTKKKMIAGILVGIGVLFLGIMTVGYVIFLKRKKLQISARNTTINHEDNMDHEKGSIDISTFDFSTIANATDNFSPIKKLGEGGYGPVYKGVLANGREIAVKRLSIKSVQGPREFQNEVILIANLQHRNLVKLIGCCIHNDERILIYEYMPNRSLDNFIFDRTKSQVLDWNTRFHIISGIARGLLYLHQDSRVRIIHRDLKTSNILLDNDMNPKISDFGLARAFGGDHDEANTVRVVGTHGYMPPEYAVYGSFSVKSDVFSFGVIVLEIISGRKSREFFNPEHNLNLIGHAWRLWSEDKQLEMIDESLKDSVVMDEALKCIQIGLLCVQDRADDRPEMSSVVLMLNGERALPSPRKPGFYPHEIVSTLNKEEFSSTNEISISILHPR